MKKEALRQVRRWAAQRSHKVLCSMEYVVSRLKFHIRPNPLAK
jgi:hypothetical protein